ncbi:MAG: hypothetical protein ACPGQL_04865 [Thermoplasmatota archaeon]
MRTLLVSACLLLTLAAPGIQAGLGPDVEPAIGTPQPGPFAGTIGDGGSNTHRFSTHGDQPCLGVWMPKLYVVTLNYVSPFNSLGVSARGHSDSGENGVASIKFVANYCTAFDIVVSGDDVSGTAAYVVTVQSSPIVGGASLA